jgi:MSHA biogenesis protein MshQ
LRGGGESVVGNLQKVGRFVPYDFLVSTPMITPHVAFSGAADDWSYLGEEFAINFTLTARNAAGGTTQNYANGSLPANTDDFGKLATTMNPVSFFAVEDRVGAADGNFTTYASPNMMCNGSSSSQRLCSATSNQFDFTSVWSDAGNGVKSFTGRLILGRQASGAPEGPYTSMLIGIDVADSDGVGDFINVNPIQLDDSADDATDSTYNLLVQHEFRYGRLLLENGYGTEIADLYDHDDNQGTADIPRGQDVLIRASVEYYDGTNFVLNTDDIATTYSSDELDFVPSSYTDNLSSLESAVVAGINGRFYQGQTQDTASHTDYQLYLRAPGAGNDGTALIELNLNDLGLKFLQYDWRDGNGNPITAEENTDGVYTDNPRALVEFGSFRGNDRIINWQEIFE